MILDSSVTAARPVPIILDPFRSHPKLISRCQPTLCHNIACPKLVASKNLKMIDGISASPLKVEYSWPCN